MGALRKVVLAVVLLEVALAAAFALALRSAALPVGTHPPGLFLVAHGLLRLMEAHPSAARAVVEHLPPSVESGFRMLAQFGPLPRADRAALALTGALTLLACASTVLPVYLLAR